MLVLAHEHSKGTLVPGASCGYGLLLIHVRAMGRPVRRIGYECEGGMRTYGL